MTDKTMRSLPTSRDFLSLSWRNAGLEDQTPIAETVDFCMTLPGFQEYRERLASAGMDKDETGRLLEVVATDILNLRYNDSLSKTTKMEVARNLTLRLHTELHGDSTTLPFEMRGNLIAVDPRSSTLRLPADMLLAIDNFIETRRQDHDGHDSELVPGEV